MRERREVRYDLRERARQLAKSVPAQQAIRQRKKKADLFDAVIHESTQQGGHLFTLEKLPTWQSHRLTHCGKTVRDLQEPVIFRENADSAGIVNLQSCGSYACPVCAPKIANRRFEEVREVLTVAKEAGYDVAMVTMTLRHSKSDRLETLWDGLLAGWRKAVTHKDWVGESIELYEQSRQSWLERGEMHEMGLGRAPRGWKKQAGVFRLRRIGKREELGVFAPMRAIELTRGEAGWHPHIHALFVFKAEASDEVSKLAQAAQIGGFFHEKFESGIAEYGLESLANSGGLDVQVMKGTAESIASYATKMALEATRADLKKGRMGGETPLQLLERAVEGEEDAVYAWQDFATVSQGRRWLTISKVLRDFAKLSEEKSDQEIAEEETTGLEVAEVTAREWKKNRLWLKSSRLLRVLEEDGAESLFEEFKAWNVMYSDVREIKEPPQP
ncbi:hypothetical protein IDM48_11535 (plasmid) [Rothia amarae]|uniref:Replication protein n=1 Tax=Rothia amarae TaxID=169480 RepID=A0A7S7B0Z3_9MICC|nr:hypothetical protein [Rothia amarae]QOW64953.1 hypothetical protein IDM48_11535 [Rothia amarae]